MAVFVRLEDSIKEAILTIMKYVRVTTGVEPTQEEIGEMLKSYFILNEEFGVQFAVVGVAANQHRIGLACLVYLDAWVADQLLPEG